MKKKIYALLTSVFVCLSFVCSTMTGFGNIAKSLVSTAASADYPAQLMNLAVKDNSKVLTENGTADNSALSVKALGSDLSASWRFDRVGADSKGTYFKLINAQSGRMLTPKGYKVSEGNSVVVYGCESVQSQHWYVIPVKNDRLGNGLYYKIVNYSDTSLALTQGSGGMTLAGYTGADNQLWLLNSDGLQGFAGYCANDNTGNIKAGDVGGLFGELVEAADFASLKKYAESDTPYTILVTNNISVTNLTQDSQNHLFCPDGRIYVHSNKTIIGSYNAHTLNNVQFCTSSGKGVGNNIIIKNFEMKHDAKSNGNDSIVVYFGSGENLWVDHVTFVGHSDYNTLGEGTPDWDKFLACCYDADYCTVSDCWFGLHEYGLILGYPDDTEDSYKNKNNFPRMSIISSKFKDTLTRAPGLMRYGYFHSLNNYVYNFSMAYTVHSDCKLFAENCYYDGASTKGNVVCDWNSVTYPGAFADSGSKGVNCKRLGIEGQAKNCTWRPASNYNYVKLTADEAKNYCDTYSGCQSSNGNMMYLRFGSKGVPSAGFNTAPDGSSAPVAATFTNGSTFRFKNANSGLYMQVEGASAKNGANVQQWGSSSDTIHDIWKLIDAGDGYYYIASAVGDGGTFMLDVAEKKTANGTNIDIYNYNGGTNQQFMIAENSDGTYKILTRISNCASAVEIADASKESGANVQQWEINNASCQNWILEAVANPGTKMDTSVVYEFKNLNSGMLMEIEGGKMEADANVQQWSSNGYDCQKWILQEFAGGGNYYYIRSLADSNYVLKANGTDNGGNISIAEYSTKDSSMLFKFSKNTDGSYYIMTRASKDARFVEVSAASKESGANVQQWDLTNSDCQKWTAETMTTTTTTTTTAQPPATTTTTTVVEPIVGDINNDGEVGTADLVMLQKWLLVCGKLENWSAADVYKDGTIDVYDLVALRQLIVK